MEERLYLLDAWREAPARTDRERAALAWTEALTLASRTRAPDADHEDALRRSDEAGLVALALLVCAIDAWNRVAIGFRSVPPDNAPPSGPSEGRTRRSVGTAAPPRPKPEPCPQRTTSDPGAHGPPSNPATWSPPS